MKLQKNKRIKSKKGKGQISFRKLLKLARGSKYKEPFLDQFKQAPITPSASK